MDWINVIIQGGLLGGFYALFAIGLSMSFGIMRLVNIAHGDLIVLSAYVALVVTQAHRARSIREPRHRHAGDVRAGLRAATRVVESNSQRRTCCRRSWSLSAFRSSSRTDCCRSSAPTTIGSRKARSRRQACSFPGGIDHRCLSARGFRGGNAGHRQLAASVLPHAAWPRLSRRLRRCRHRRTDGHRQSQALRAGAGNRDDFHGARRCAVRHPNDLRAAVGTDPADPRFRGRHHRRARQHVGHADRRRRAWRRPGRRRGSSIRTGKFWPDISPFSPS